MRGDDDDALGWGGEADDPTHVGGPTGAAASVPLVDGASVTTPATGSALVVVYGVLAGVYVLGVIGWVLAAQQNPLLSANLMFEVMHQLGQFLAIVSPIAWFGVTFLLTDGRRAIARVIWLVVGGILIAPWPFILSGAAI